MASLFLTVSLVIKSSIKIGLIIHISNLYYCMYDLNFIYLFTIYSVTNSKPLKLASTQQFVFGLRFLFEGLSFLRYAIADTHVSRYKR